MEEVGGSSPSTPTSLARRILGPAPALRARHLMLLPLLALAALVAPQGVRHAQVTAEFTAPSVEQGATAELLLRFSMDPGWHIYHPDDASGMGLPPSVSITTEGFVPEGKLSTTAEPHRQVDKIGAQTVTQLWLEGTAELRLPVRAAAAPGTHSVEVVVSWMECNERMCLPPTKASIPLALEVLAGEGAAAEQLPADVPLSGRVDVEYEFPEKLAQGKTYPLRFTLRVEEGLHVYHPDQDPEWGEAVGVSVIGEGFALKSKPKTLSKPRVVREQVGDFKAEYLWLGGEVDFEAEIEVTGDPAVNGARVRIGWQACDDSLCFDAEGISFLIGNAVVAAGATGEIVSAGSNGLAADGFFAFLLLAIGAGLLTLLTPCVFPMIPVTISYFTKRADDGKGTPLGNASAYAGGIIFTFAGIGVGAALLLGPAGANAIGSNPWVNLGIGALFVWMALSLLGFYEIQAPRFLQNFASKTQAEGRQKGGYLPVMLMAIAFSITAFTCTVAFVGAIFAAGLNLGLIYLLGGMLVYGAVFALPFFFLALFPSWLKTLPQAGGWMNVVKVSAGFIELIAAIKFLSNTDLRFNLHVLTWPVAIGLTMLFLLLWAAYMFGLFRTHHDYEKAKPGKARVAIGVLALGCAAFLAPGLWERSEKAFAGGWVEAYLPPFSYGAERYALDGGVIKAGDLSWQLAYQAGWDIAVENGTPLFLDFTGITCINCRKMESDVFPHEDVLPLLASMARTELWVDKPPHGDWNTQLELDRFQQASQPLYAVIDPRDDAVLAEKKDGYDPDPAVFAAFLQQGLDAYAARTPGPMPAAGPYHQQKPPPVGEEVHFPWLGTLILRGIGGLAVGCLVFALWRGELSKRREEAELAAA